MTKHQAHYSSRRFLLAVIAGAAFTGVEAPAGIQYHVTDLGTLGGTYTYGIGINARGQVSGYSYTSGDPFVGDSFHAFLWTPTTSNGVNGTMQDLGTLGGSSSNGFGINDSGQVSGYSGAGDGLQHAFLWTPTTPNGANGIMNDLGPGTGFGISDSGRTSGATDVEGGESHAFLYDGTMHDLGTLGGSSSAGFDVNANGQVIGYSLTTEDAANHAFLWTPTSPNGVTGAMTDLGAPGATFSIGIGINDSGQVTGRSDGEAFLWTPTTPNGTSGMMLGLGTLGGSAVGDVISEGHGINNHGQVTGGSFASGTEGYHAFLYTTGIGMVDLNSLIDPLSGWELQFGAGINDAGQITGQGLIGGEQRAFLLTPINVPEPVGVALVVLCLSIVTPRFKSLHEFARPSRRAWIVLAWVAPIVLPAQAPAATYSILDLGTLGGTVSYAYGVNSTGQVVGYSYTTSDTAFHAFRTAPNGPITAASDLGFQAGGSQSFGVAVNDGGQAVGSSDVTANIYARQAFRTAANGLITASSDLGSLGGLFNQPRGINASGQVTGTSTVQSTSGAYYHAFRTAANGLITPASDLGSLGGTISEANAINESGQVVGYSYTGGNTVPRAFRTSANGPITPASDLGTLGGNSSSAYGINSSGQVVGDSITANGLNHAFRTEANGPITPASDLGTLYGLPYSYAFGINSIGQTVGYCADANNAHQLAFAVDVEGHMLDLNALIPTGSGWVLNQATGINDRGQIAGFGTSGGQIRAFLLTPIPEPSSVAYLPVVLATIVRQYFRRWVQRKNEKRAVRS